ncbi:MAG: hypothetical protein ACKODX_01095 [Gemmata sp.]
MSDTAAAWSARADELADWALARFFVRRDRYGGYIRKRDELWTLTMPRRGTQDSVVTPALLKTHFEAESFEAVIGYHHLAPGTSVGRVAAADIDAHSAEEQTEAVFERNRKYAEHIYYNLAALGFRPLLSTWGGGSFHLEVLFASDVPGAVLHSFGRWLVCDASEFKFPSAVESFPKRAAVKEDGFGNWLRLVGRHHKRDEWARVFDGTNWLEGEHAVAHLLALEGDAPELIPAAALPREPEPEPVPAYANGKGAPPQTSDRPDVFAAWVSRVQLDDVVAWLQRAGHTLISRTANRADFTRAGKESGASLNVAMVGGVPLTYNFSPNAGLPVGAALNPVHLRCLLDYGATDTPAMAKLAAALKVELGWAETPKVKMSGAGATGDQERTGAAIILDHFRDRYAPVFKRGTAICGADGTVTPMGEACVLCDSELIELLSKAADAPRYAGKNAEVKRSALPGFFKTWAKVAWGDLLRSLPDEDAADLGGSAAARDEFRRLVRDALLSQVALGDVIGKSDVTQVERRSLIDWCEKFAKSGPWRSIRSYRCWCKVGHGDGGELVVQVAVRHELFAQVKADRRLCQLTSNIFTRRAVRYGVGAADRAERPHGQSAVVLDAAFVEELLRSTPSDEPAGSQGTRGSSAVPGWSGEVLLILDRNGPLTLKRLDELSGYGEDRTAAALRHHIAAGHVVEEGGLYRAALAPAGG